MSDLLDIQDIVHIDPTPGEPEVLLPLPQVVLVLVGGEGDGERQPAVRLNSQDFL